MGNLTGDDRITVARIAGVSSRLATQTLTSKSTDAEAAAELAEVAGGRADLLAEHAGLTLGTSESGLPMQVEMGRERARLCVLAGADPGELAPWVELGRRRASQGRHQPFSGQHG
jgi:hypothetical protein